MAAEVHLQVMEKEINCRNFRGLFNYLKKHYGDQGVHQVLDDLLTPHRFFIADKNDPALIRPLEEADLTDTSYWISNACSLALLANVKKVVPGPRALFTAGEGATLESFSRNVLFLGRILGPKRVAKRAPKINALFNRTKTVELTETGKHSILFKLDYFPGFEVTKDVCQWNMGIYSGLAKLSGALNVQVEEKTCRVDGDPCCTIQVSWKHVHLWERMLQWLMRAGLKDLIDDYEQALLERTQVIDQLTLSEKRYKVLTENSLEEKKKFQFLVEKSPYGVALIDEQGDFLYISPKFVELFGYTREDLPSGTVWFDKAFPDEAQRKQVLSAWQEGLKSPPPGELGTASYKVRCKDGTEKWIHFSSASLIDGTQLVTYEDITERKEQEDERMIISKLESTGILAGGIAHDFNNLLAVILGNLELMEPLDQNQKELMEFLKSAKRAALEARGLTHQLITLSRGGDPVKKVFSLSSLLQEQVPLTLRGSSVSFQVSLPPDLWDVEADEGQIGQVIRNIVLNAREAMPESGSISITAANMEESASSTYSLPPGSYLRVTISDQGSGIPEEILDKIFDPYFSTKQRGNQKGMGLGLTICRSIIQKHGGTILMESKPGLGTSCHLILPAGPKGLPGDSAAQNVSPGKRRILIMDDEEMVRDLLHSILTRLGYDVHVTENGEKAMADFLREKELGHPFDLLLLDLTIRGGMGGKEVIRELLRIDPGVKAVVSSGYAQDPVLIDYDRYGFKAALTKPFLISEINRVLTDLLE